LLERLRAFAVCLEQCTGAEVRNAYDAEMGAMTEQSEEQLCFVGLCLAEAKRRGLDTSAWPDTTVILAAGSEGQA
jgi:hypothetical protein